MNTWIFQGNPKRFNIDDYLLENDIIYWSMRQTHLIDKIQLHDEVFIWRSDGNRKGTGGIIARAQVISLPQQYISEEEIESYWYEHITESYLAVELKLLEVDVVSGINRLELASHPILKNLMILKLKQNTNYFVSEDHASYLKQLWYRKYKPYNWDVTSRFPVVTELKQVQKNMKQFKDDLEVEEKLQKQLKSFQQWYYIHSENLLAPSKFIGYQNMKGHMYVDKDAIVGLDGRETEKVLKEWFLPTENEQLKAYVKEKLEGRINQRFTINILKSEKEIVEQVFMLHVNDTDIVSTQSKNKCLEDAIEADLQALEIEEGNGIEGAKKAYFVNKYERNAKNRMKAIEIHGLDCYVCGFNFEDVYGEHGKSFIEVHHIQPLSTLKDAIEINPATDLVPLCANCHRMVHRKKDKPLSIEELKQMLNM